MFTNSAVAHQYLVYEEKGHFSKIVDINLQGGVSIYKLPFWHYTTPSSAGARRNPPLADGCCSAHSPSLKDRGMDDDSEIPCCFVIFG